MERGGKVKSFKVVLLSILVITSFAAFLFVVTTAKPVKAVAGTFLENNFLPTDDAEVMQGHPDYLYELAIGSSGPESYHYWIGYQSDVNNTASSLRTRVYLKWNLSGFAGVTVDNAYLMLFNKYGVSNGESPYNNNETIVLDVCKVANDGWSEGTITWNNAPAMGDVIDSTFIWENWDLPYANSGSGIINPSDNPEVVNDMNRWWSWNITSWFREQLAGDKIMSIGLKGQVEADDNVVWFYAKDAYETQPRARIVLNYSGRAVSVSTRPKYLDGYPGGTLVYGILVKNIGTVTDTYTLGVSDTKGWTKSLSKTVVGPFNHGESEEVTLRVTIPSSAALGTEDTITVTATSAEYTELSTSAICTGHAAEQLTPTDDTFVYKKQPTFTYGTTGYMFAGNKSNPDGAERSFLKFDLNGIPPGTTIGGAKLWIYCYKTTGGGSTVQCWSASDSVGAENWREGTATWNNQPSMVSLLDSRDVNAEDNWYSWDVTNFVSDEFAVDKVVSFALKDPNEDSPDHSPHFDTKEGEYAQWPYLEIVLPYQVDVNISYYEVYKDNVPGGTLKYENIWINNTGTSSDTYNLSVSDDKGWHPALSPPTVGPIAPDSSEIVTLTVAIPSGAVRGTEDTITVTAVSQTQPSVTDSDRCIAQAFIGLKPTPIADAYVVGDLENRYNNYGGEVNLFVGRYFETWENAYLKFNISGVPENEAIQKAELWMWCWATYPYNITDIYMEACRVDDDSWTEDGVTWNNSPAIGSVLNTVHVTVDDNWYKWDVTNFVKEQRWDNLVSLLVRARADSSSDKAAKFDSKEYDHPNDRPFLKIFYSPPTGVNVEITPSSQDNIPGGTLRYTVKVTNTGGASDTYTLMKGDNAGWTLSLPSSVGPIASGSSGNVTLTVTIPSGATPGTRDNIWVTATSTVNTAVSDNKSCIAHAVAPTRGVDVSISPTFKSGLPRSTLTYTMTVKNTGTVTDTYTLTNGDNAGWTLSPLSSVGPLAPNASGNVTLSVTVPSDAVVNTRDNIWVKATSNENNAVSDNASCIAQAISEIIRGVRVSISPSSQDNIRGGTLTYTVTVMDNGNVTEDYNLSKTDTRTWTLTLVSSVVDVIPGENRQVTLTVGIPAAAEINTSDNITVTATSSENTAVKDNASCTARCVTSGVGTSLTIFPSRFALYPGYTSAVQDLMATLRDGNYNPIANKVITWSATTGSVSPSSGTTDAGGQISVTYTAPTVTAQTSATITASFAGDSTYGASSGTSLGIPAISVSENISASTGGTVVINFIQTNVTVNILVVPPNALSENTAITVVQAPPESPSGYAMMGCIFDIGPSGTTFTTPATLTLPYDENELPAGMSEDDLAIYHYNTSTNSWERLGGTVDKTANTISIQIDHLSEYSVMVSISQPPSPPLPWLTIGIIIAVVSIIAVIALLIRRRGGGEDIFNP